MATHCLELDAATADRIARLLAPCSEGGRLNRTRLPRIVLLALALTTTPGTAANAQETARTRFAEWLSLAGWPPERWEALANIEVLTVDQELDLLTLAERFARLPPDEMQSIATRLPAGLGVADALPAGAVVTFRAHVVRAEVVASQADSQHFRLTVATDDDARPVTLLTPTAPRRWLTKNEQPLHEPIACTGIVARTRNAGLLVSTPRVAWLPTVADGERVRYGEALLGGAGVDIGLLDRFAEGRSLSADESEPFYRTLAGCGEFAPGQLLRAATDNLPRYQKRWQSILKADGAQRRLAAAVAKQTREGRYSVAPLFNDALHQRGELVAFAGLARRAVRIDLTLSRDGSPSRLPARYGIDHYYELEVFPPDSQNLPLVFCVLELPDGFPTGDTIQERVRVAGIFLKRWAYRTRKPGDAPGAGDRRQLAPLLVGRGPMWLPNETSAGDNTGQLVAGLAFVAVLAVIALALRRQAQADRRFERSTLARYKGGSIDD